MPFSCAGSIPRIVDNLNCPRFPCQGRSGSRARSVVKKGRAYGRNSLKDNKLGQELTYHLDHPYFDN